MSGIYTEISKNASVLADARNRGGLQWVSSVSDAAEDTGVSTGHAAGAHHQARDDATSSGYFSRGSGNTDKWDRPSAEHASAREVFAEVFRSAIFGSKK